MTGKKKGRTGAHPRPPMPAGAEAVRAQRQARLAASAATPAPRPPEDRHGGTVVIWSAWLGTAVFTMLAAVAVVVPAARLAAVAVDLVLLLGGSGLYFWGWAVAAARSREVEISLWNLLLLEDVAPNRVRAQLLGALGMQVAVAAATCWITAALAFGWLVPVWGLAHCQFWGARYGVFPSRPPAPARGRAAVGGRGRRA